VLGIVKSTKDNLMEAINGESYEFQKMYPRMIEDAQAEGNAGALQSFNYANAVEKVHAALYQKALDSLGRNKETDYYICAVCGYTAEGEAPDECPVCKAKKQAFHKVE
jgi:rubrerythrin